MIGIYGAVLVLFLTSTPSAAGLILTGLSKAADGSWQIELNRSVWFLLGSRLVRVVNRPDQSAPVPEYESPRIWPSMRLRRGSFAWWHVPFFMSQI